MGKSEYSEDMLIQAPTADFLEEELGWESVMAMDEGPLVVNGLLGRTADTQVVLVRDVEAALRRFNPGLPDAAYTQALAQVIENDPSKSLVQMNQEKYKLLRDGVLVSFRDNTGKAAGKLVEKRLRLIDFDKPERNRFLAVRELWVRGALYLRRPDLIGYVNGLPLVFLSSSASMCM